MRRVIVAAALAAALSGCGGSSTPPTPVPTGLTITGNDGLLFLGQTYTFTATLQLSNGTSNVVAGTWGSDAPSVATAQASTGQVQVLGIGEATIFVDAQGLRGTRRIRTTVNYQGQLDTGLRTTSCTQSGVFAAAKVCGEFPVGTIFGFTGVFTQTGDAVVATMDLVEFPADPVGVTVNNAGELRFTSEHREEDLAATAQWVLRPSGLSQIEGTATWRIRLPGSSGAWEVRGNVLPRAIVRSIDERGAAAGALSLRDALHRIPR